MRPRSDAEYSPVRSLVRGLDLLLALNAHDKGRASLAQLAAQTGLHRTTVRRLLETLIDEGYVRRSASDDRYGLALKVRSLAEGFRDEERVSALAGPVLAELLQQVRWPSDLCTPDGGSMLIRESTHRFSALSFNRAMVGERLPMLLTAAGRAYFCHCADEEREALRALLHHDPVQSQLAADERFIANLLERTRTRGYSSNEGDWMAERRIGAIAVPVFDAGKVIASINVIYLTRAISHTEAAARYLPALAHAGRELERALASPAC
jgi:IclR family mhp operon transcriptional activator